MDNPEPRTLLFLSVDIIGSSAHKSGAPYGNIEPWIVLFREFYKEFPQVFIGKFNTEDGHLRPFLWKGIGDELVFVVDRLRKHKDAVSAIKHFKDAVAKYSQTIETKKGKGSGLGLKASAWLAGCTAYNFEIIMENGINIESDGGIKQPGKVEYLGPSIDLGFRLAKFATQRKFIVSCDLARLLVERTDDLVFFFDGKERMKGVFNEKPYPVIWIDMDDGKSSMEEALIGIKKEQCNHSKLKKFCDNFLDESSDITKPPYLGREDSDFSKPPSDYSDRLAKIRSLDEPSPEPVDSTAEAGVDAQKAPAVKSQIEEQAAREISPKGKP